MGSVLGMGGAGASTTAASPFVQAAVPAAVPAVATGVEAAPVFAATPALAPAASAAPWGGALGSAVNSAQQFSAAPAFGNSAGITYGQLANAARRGGDTQSFMPMMNSYMQHQNNAMTGLPPEQPQQPDAFDQILRTAASVAAMALL